MLGGGTFTTQNKVLPGAYINFVSKANATSVLSDRGVVSMPFAFGWGTPGEIIKVDADLLGSSKCMETFGYSYEDDEMADIRDIMLNATTLLFYRLPASDAVAAANTYATAKCVGTRGNDIKIVVQANVDDSSKVDVKTYIKNDLVDSQTVKDASELVENAYVTFKSSITVTTGSNLTGGANGTVSASAYSDYLKKLESYSFNTVGIKTTDATVKSVAAAWVKRMRDSIGLKCQLVLADYASADYEGVISLANGAAGLPWLLGAEGGCAINATCTNKIYTGEAEIENVLYTQSELESYIENGQVVFHTVGDDVRVLRDINTLETLTSSKGEDFKNNQTIRIIDQIATDIASMFNSRYLGNVLNNDSGRAGLWGDIVAHHTSLQDMGCIENFDSANVTVTKGDKKTAVVVSDAVQIVNSMEQLYMTVTVQ